MILSDEGIRRALAAGEIEIDPIPQDDQYQTSAVDIFLGDVFRVWDRDKFAVPGLRVALNLTEQRFGSPPTNILGKPLGREMGLFFSRRTRSFHKFFSARPESESI